MNTSDRYYNYTVKPSQGYAAPVQSNWDGVYGVGLVGGLVTVGSPRASFTAAELKNFAWRGCTKTPL